MPMEQTGCLAHGGRPAAASVRAVHDTAVTTVVVLGTTYGPNDSTHFLAAGGSESQ